MFTQKFRQLDACLSKLQSAVTAEKAAETEENRREAERVNADNMRRAAAAAAASASQRTTPTPTTCDATDGANDDGSSGEDGEDDDGYDSEILIPVSPARDGVGMSPSRTSSPPAPASSSSSARRGLTMPRVEEGGEPTTALSGGSSRASTSLSAGVGTGGSTAVGAPVAGKRSRSSATAAAATSGRSAPTAAVAPPKGGARPAVRFLEDLLPAPGQARRPKGRPRADAGAGNTGKRSKKTRTAHDEAPAQSSGPLSGLSLCVVRLGSVTSNTIKIFTKGVCNGGGKLSTHYTPGSTTHIVADASLALSWEKLDLYFSGWDDLADDVAVDAGGKASQAGAGTPDGVPIVSSEWMSECLKRSAVVPTDGYLLVPPTRRAAAAAAMPPAASAREPSSGAAAGKSSTGGGGGAAASTAAAAAAAAAAASAAPAPAGGKRKSASADEETGRLAAASVRPPERKQARAAMGGEAPARSQKFPVEGGHGARNPNIGDKSHTFFCQATSSAPQTVLNEEAAQKLERLAELCAARGGDGSVFRERGFKTAAGVLRRLDVQITNIQQLKDLRKNEPRRVRGLGESVMKELTTFYEEGKMNRLDGLEADPRVRCLELFQTISWVGPKKAEELCAHGLRTIEDVRTKGQHLLTEQARVCLNRHEDITQRMPRSEAAEIEALVTKEAQGICPGVICQACGSYRRGKSHCGDVDVLIRPPEGQEDVELLQELVSKLTDTGFITDKLAMPEGSYKPGKSQTYMGICKLPGEGRLHRRLDIKVYPTSMFAFAVLYFTGSGHFNMSMRAFAKQKGLKLSDKGLFKVNRVDGEEVHRSDDSYRCLREEDVFAALGLDWREPKDRDGVQVEGFYDRKADGALRLEGRVAPVPSEADLEQRQRAFLQQQRFPAAEAQPWRPQQQWQEKEHERMMQQQAAAYFEQKEDEELQQALLLSRGAFGAGAAAAAGERAGAAAEAGNHGGGDYEDQMVQEALRRSVADTAAAAATRLGGDEEVWEKLPPEAMAGGGGVGGGGGGGGGFSERGGGVTDGGGNGVGAGTEDSPVCL